MKKIVRLTESDLARIVRRVINESDRQYLMEDTGYDSTQGPKINDGPAAYNYFMGIVKKTKTLKKGTTFIGKNTYWVVTSDWAEVTQPQMGIDGYRSDILMRGIVKRNGFYFDVSDNNESMQMTFAQTNGDSFLNSLTGNEAEKWLPNTQTLKSLSAGTPGGNMALVGGLANFKKMVNGLPDKNALLRNYLYSTKPDVKNAVPQDQMDLYGTTPTKKPTQPK